MFIPSMLVKINNQVGSIFKSFNNLQIVYTDPNKGLIS